MAKASKDSRSGFVDNWQSGKSLAECNLQMLTSEDSCDVSFRVGKDRKLVRAHRYVLISRSCVFHAMLCGPLAEKNEITITDVEADIFSGLLRYLYTNESVPNPESVTGLLYLAKKYAVGGLEHLCLTYLKSSLSAENACVILEQAHVFDEKQLYDRALKVILDNGEKCLRVEGFKHLCRECFDKVISYDQLDVKPEQMFSAALSWTEEECRRQGREVTPVTLRSILGQTLYIVPFHEMSQRHFVKDVIPRNILTSDETVVIMSHHVCPENDLFPFRRRGKKTKPVCRHDSADIILCNKHKKFGKCLGANMPSGFRFTPSHDVVLLGVYVYGSKKMEQPTYNLKVTLSHSILDSQCLLEVDCHSIAETKFEENFYIRPIYLKESQKIKGGLQHSITIRLPCTSVPEYVGDDVVHNKTVGTCTFSYIDSFYQRNIIYGLILKQ